MRILIVDDDASVRDTYRQLFARDEDFSKSRQLANALFGSVYQDPALKDDPYRITYASQGLEAVEMVRRAIAEGDPYRVAFIDVRMPPGIDGRETARRIRQLDAAANLVIVTGYSDYPIAQIAQVAGPVDKLFYLAKPFSGEEIRHLARALVLRWDADSTQVALLQEKIAELEASEARALHLAQHDSLTGALNRRGFRERLQERLAKGHQGLYLALANIDRFRQINDTVGQEAGDELLLRATNLLHDRVSPGSLIARLGADEFAVAFEAENVAGAMAAAQNILDSFRGSHTLFGANFVMGATVGLVECAAVPTAQGNDLIRFADLARTAARESGQSIRLFEAELDRSRQVRHKIEAALHEAIAQDRLDLHYQPIVESTRFEIVGYEALLRWHDPELGPVAPSVFVPIAEESGLIGRLGEWVVSAAMKDAARWPGKITSINVSPGQFRDPGLAEMLGRIAAQHGIAPPAIQLEITETALFRDVDNAAPIVARLREQGFLVALDDFGTGYSSMASLRKLPVDSIKIDYGFVSGLDVERQASAIVRSIAHLARGLGLSLVAEGVEDARQCETLREIGCTHLQGYLFGAPASPDYLGLPLEKQSDAART